MRIAFFGSTQIGWRVLNELITLGEDIVGVFTVEQKISISYAEKPVSLCTHHDFRSLEKKGVPVHVLQEKTAEFLPILTDMKPDLAIACGWYHMIPDSLRVVPKKGFVCMHPSLLPRYRGGAPVNWAIINGEKKTGITLFFIDKGVDSGDIASQRAVMIEYKDDVATVYRKVEQAALLIIQEMIPRFKAGDVKKVRQDHPSATTFPQRKPEDGRIDWSRSSLEIYNWVRAQTKPYPGAYTLNSKGEELIIWQAGEVPSPPGKGSRPGTIQEVRRDGVVVQCKSPEKSVLLKEVRPQYGEDISAAAYARARGLNEGDMFL